MSPETNAPIAGSPAEHMKCLEVCGGSQLTARGLVIGGLDAWVYSKPFGESPRGGDVYYASSCAAGRITRLLLADVSGHGKTVAGIAADLRLLMRRYVNRPDQSEFVRLLNQQFAALSRDGAFATAIVTTFFSPNRRLVLCNAGHPRPILYRASREEWSLLGEHSKREASPSNLPLGIVTMAEYEHFDLELEPGDCVVTYTDALIESSDADGEQLGEDGVLRLLKLLGNAQPEKLIAELLGEIAERYPENLSTDDVTVLLLRANGGAQSLTLMDKMRAMGRMASAALRSLVPGSSEIPS
ncbi:MAG TPA: PP2C family protein-serine/threonine phosphatase [Bryobacteraceae bacterium]|nr:PP2C family protein-serine/threonine phosphatase [Bryobacteraceae bacterium]